jgi:transposase-like protein
MAEEAADTPQRWTAKRRAALVLSIVKGETSIEAAARKFSLTEPRLTIQNDRLL